MSESIPVYEVTSESHVPGIADRLYKLLNSILQDGTLIPKMYHPVILNLVKPYLKKASDLELAIMIHHLQDEIIPWVLYDKDIGK